MKTKKNEFVPGDCLYYDPHDATGVLIEKDLLGDGTVVWKYLLRSPRSLFDPEIRTSIRHVEEDKIRAAVNSGQLRLL